MDTNATILKAQGWVFVCVATLILLWCLAWFRVQVPSISCWKVTSIYDIGLNCKRELLLYLIIYPLTSQVKKDLQMCCCISWTPQVLFMSLLQTIGEVYVSLAENSHLIQNSHTIARAWHDSGSSGYRLRGGVPATLCLGIISASLGLTLLVYKVGRVRRLEMTVLGSPIPFHTCRMLQRTWGH